MFVMNTVSSFKYDILQGFRLGHYLIDLFVRRWDAQLKASLKT